MDLGGQLSEELELSGFALAWDQDLELRRRRRRRRRVGDVWPAPPRQKPGEFEIEVLAWTSATTSARASRSSVA